MTAFLLAAAIAGLAGLAASTAPDDLPPCAYATATPIYQGVGWTHFVDVANECDVEIACDVATTVDPSPTYPIRVASGEIMRVRTRYGSPTWLFEPIVSCELASSARTRSASSAHASPPAS